MSSCGNQTTGITRTTWHGGDTSCDTSKRTVPLSTNMRNDIEINTNILAINRLENGLFELAHWW
jgi:hypothetical protein